MTRLRNVEPGMFDEGTKWSWVPRNGGGVRHYVVASAELHNGMEAIVRLTNIDNAKDAWATKRWLLEEDGGWQPGHVQGELASAA